MGLWMLRGEIRLVDLEPVQGTEANKRRPAVVVSNDRANASASKRGRGVVTVVPLSSNIARVLPFQVLLPSEDTALHSDSKAQAEQIRSVSVARLGGVIGRVPPRLMAAIDDALRLHLQL
jgi:mRNA interferase MazF